jgi:uncharacterized coiled-coil protein SlyX
MRADTVANPPDPSRAGLTKEARRGVAKTRTTGSDKAEARRTRRKVARLERRLAELSAQEATRRRKLARTQERVAAVKEQLRELRAVAGSATGEEADAGVAAYCLRERRRVTLTNALPITLRNGRAALAGTCPSCGVRIVSMATARG